MTEIRDPICIRELLKDHRKELCIIPFFTSRARKKYEEILKNAKVELIRSTKWECEILNIV